MIHTITLSDGRKVEVDLYTDGWCWVAATLPSRKVSAISPTEADAIEALRKKLDRAE